MTIPARLTTACAAAALLAAGGAAAQDAVVQADNDWFTQAQETLAAMKQRERIEGPAKNVILFVGDGMGVSTVTAARILEGQQRGESGEGNLLSFERFPYLALTKTYNTNQQVPDSAGTSTAMHAGVKTKAGVIGVNEEVLRGDCESARGKEVTNIAELAEQAGISVGIISTARITHATPAAVYAHSPERNWEDDKDMPKKAIAAGCVDISSQLIEYAKGDSLKVAMGGGRRSFLPGDMADPEDETDTGERADGRDLTEEFTAISDGAEYVWNAEQFAQVDPQATDKLLGLFNSSHMQYEADRADDAGGEPSLAEMTELAIEMLSQNDDGYYLMVESGRVDHGHHGNNAYRALTDAVAFHEAVAKAVELTDEQETLILVTADHGHVMTISGYPTIGNPILGLVVGNEDDGLPSKDPMLAADDMPYTTLSYTNGPGAPLEPLEVPANMHVTDTTGPNTVSNTPPQADGADGDGASEAAATVLLRANLMDVDTADKDYIQAAAVPLRSETHSGEDVALYARGPNAHLVDGTVEQNYIFHLIDDALRLRQRAAGN